MYCDALVARHGAIAPATSRAARANATRRVPAIAPSNLHRRAALSGGFSTPQTSRLVAARNTGGARGSFRTQAVTPPKTLAELDLCDVEMPEAHAKVFAMDISTPTVLTSDLASVMDPPMCNLAPKKTHIICTLGPSSRTVDDLEKLLLSGMSVARFNFSHGTHEYHLEILQNLRTASDNTGKICAVLLDTKGPEIRTGALVDGNAIALKRGSTIELTTDYGVLGTSERVAISYQHLARVRISQSPYSASLNAHTRTRRDYCPDCLLVHITRD